MDLWILTDDNRGRYDSRTCNSEHDCHPQEPALNGRERKAHALARDRIPPGTRGESLELGA